MGNGKASTVVTAFARIAFLTCVFSSLCSAATMESDVCVYGGTSGGIAAAIQSSRMGHKVILLEFGKHLGGLTTGGLGATDIGNKGAIGGISREFYGRIAKHYSRDSSWRLETRADYFSRRASGQANASDLGAANATMWTFEPHVAEDIFKAMIREANVPIHYGQRLASVKKDGLRITEITMEDGNTFVAKMFIDATYEGDLMAKAGISYHVGREANSQYGETLNGVRAQTPSHQFTVPVDPYVTAGDPASGLLPFIQPGSLAEPGAGDKKVQTYNYRLCFTTNAVNRMPVEPPPGYDP